MVFFSCDCCNETLKKNQVDGHASRCRGCHSVSCVDCLVSFYGDDYRQHTSCMTEVERYEKKTPAARAKTKKSPQDVWMELVQESVELAPSNLKGYLKTIASLDNVPRKEKQFRNFASNSLGLRGSSAQSIVGDIWNFLKEVREKQQAERQQQEQEQKEREEEAKKKAEEAAKEHSTDEATESKSSVKPDSKKVKKAMKKALKANNNKLKLKELRKKVQTQLALPKTAKDELKRIITETAQKKDSFVLNGKEVSLTSN